MRFTVVSCTEVTVKSVILEGGVMSAVVTRDTITDTDALSMVNWPALTGTTRPSGNAIKKKIKLPGRSSDLVLSTLCVQVSATCPTGEHDGYLCIYIYLI